MQDFTSDPPSTNHFFLKETDSDAEYTSLHAGLDVNDHLRVSRFVSQNIGRMK